VIWDLFLFGMFFGVTTFFGCLIIGFAVELVRHFRRRK